MATDPYVGKLAFVRVYSGVLKKGQNVFNPRTQKRERMSRLAAAACESPRGRRGAVRRRDRRHRGLKQVTTGDTLCAENQPIVLERIQFPGAGDVHGDRAEDAGGPGEAGRGAGAWPTEDPTCQMATDAETGQTLIKRHGRAAPGDPEGPDAARVQGAGERGQADGGVPRDDPRRRPRGARVRAGDRRPRPVRPRGGGDRAASRAARATRSSSRCRDGQDPGEFQDAVEEGIQDGLITGVVGNYPLIDVRVRVVGGSFASRGLDGGGLPHGGGHGAAGGGAGGAAGAAGADHGAGDHDAGGVPGRRAGRSEQAAGAGEGDGGAGGRADHPGGCAAGGAVRLLHGDAFADEGPGELHDGAALFRSGAGSVTGRAY